MLVLIELCRCPAYSVPDRSNFFSVRLAAEAEAVKKKLVEYLSKFVHLTLTFDGWSSKGHDEIYSVHLTTPLRRSFLVDGLILTGLSCTGETIFDGLKQIILLYLSIRISLVVSDSAKNVRKARRLICNQWPWILNSPDPSHLLNLLGKDLIVGSKTYPKVKGFADVLTTVSTFTTYFSHSNYGQYHLQQEMKKEVDKRGIEAAGATRFSTFSINAKSVYRCWPAIMRCFHSNVLIFEGKGSQTIRNILKDEDKADRFRSDLRTVIEILSPIERGLTTLEGQNCTLSDVFLIFIGVGIGFTRVFSDPSRSISQYRDESFAAFNRRFAFIIEESTKDMFLLAYLLDPGEFQWLC